MKSIIEKINESVVNEGMVEIGMIISSVILAISMFIAGELYTHVSEFANPYTLLKSWIKDKKAVKIAEKLAKDPEVVAFLDQPKSKQQRGWRKLLQSKLSEDEFEYITRITKDLVKSNM